MINSAPVVQGNFVGVIAERDAARTERDKAEKMIRKAEETCLIARAMRTPVELQAEVRIEAGSAVLVP